MCCMSYKGKEVEGYELKLSRLTADKKQRKVRWSPLSETGQKGDSMFATLIRTALFFKLFYLLYFGQNSCSVQMLSKTGVGVYIPDVPALVKTTGS